MKNLILTLTFSFITIFAFSQRNKLFFTKHVKFNESQIYGYKKIVEGLNLNYVLWYRNYTNSHGTAPSLYFQIPACQFELDSITYWKCYNDFFKQDLQIVFWLLTFKHDYSTEEPMWSINLDPYSSYISECNWPRSNARSAIILIENYLNGEGINCYECYSKNRKSCNRKKYRQIEQFIQGHQNNTISEIRTEWKHRDASN